MQTIAVNNVRAENLDKAQSFSFSKWFEETMVAAEENRFGVVAAFILLQVTIAGFNVVIPPMFGASAYLIAPGVVMAFLSNGLALAQAKMKYVLIGFVLSMIINAAVSIYCVI